MSEDLINRISFYLASGGLFNPELADHIAVRTLLFECREALAQPEITTGNILMDSYKAMQSMKVEGPRHVVCQCDKCKAQPEQKPMHPQLKAMLEEYFDKCFAESATQRTWVGLTEDEAFACKGRDYFETYKAIEAKLKEKNT